MHGRASIRGLLILAAFAALALACYAPALDGPFVFDDICEIQLNRGMRTLWPPHVMLAGGRLPHRPITYLTFAVNYRLHGLSTRGYHVVNVLVHAANAWLVGWLATRGLRRLAGETTSGTASLVGWLAASVWLVHPLCSQPVAYIYQRMELLGAMGILGALACYERWLSDPGSRGWLAAAVAASGIGMACKETAVVTPLLVPLYDILVAHAGLVRGMSRSALLALLRRRLIPYAAFAATWLVLAAVVASQRHRYPELHAGNDPGRRLWYLLNQSRVLLHYLRLAFWPDPLCLDHGWPETRNLAALLPATALVAACGAGLLLATRRHPGAAFLGLSWFLLLAPTSSIVPVSDLCVEHRMYLPLACLSVATTAGLFHAATNCLGKPRGPRVAAGALAVIVAILATTTFARAHAYQSVTGIWLDTVGKAPANARAWLCLARNLLDEGDAIRAEGCLHEALRARPGYADAMFHMGNAVAGRDRSAAAEWYRKALAIRPDDVDSLVNLAVLLALENDPEAETLLARAVALKPGHVEALANYGNLLLERGDIPGARAWFERAAKQAPDDPVIRGKLEAVTNAAGSP